LLKATSRAAFQKEAREWSAAARTKTAADAREGLYRELQDRLSQLQTERTSSALTQAVTQTTKPVFLSAISGQQLAVGGQGQPGTDTSLADLAPTLGLNAPDRQFQVSLNGTSLTFDATQSLSDVVGQINRSDAGVDATFNSSAQRLELRAREAGTEAIDATDVSGNLFATLGVTPDRRGEILNASNAATGTERTVTTVSEEGKQAFEAFARHADELRSLLDGAAGPNGAFKDDPLLTDLRDAVRGLFGPSADGSVKTFGDAGAVLQDDQLQVDGNKLSRLAKDRPNDLMRMWDVFFGEPGNTLFKDGQTALEDKLAQTPLEQRLAEQSVHVKAEVSRMADRQRTLLFQQARFERQQDHLKTQEGELRNIQNKLKDQVSGKPEKKEFPPQPLKDLLRTNPAEAKPDPQPAPEAPSPSASAPQPPGLLSFGLSD
jgi:flagellar capping protein FliD